ncbi:OmpP1/FadL family transporter [Candidatus Sororendozoicomonas aggregata]|uniref:OmpP1/FadL family transporter n=1 Tax=Candidatus Sororendozoicomonas aggregata TaxID=3073239 RepID=UPI002ED5B5AC
MRVCSIGLVGMGLLFSSLSSMAGASGVGINEHSASTLGTAYAGRVSNAEDASIGASNPAGIAFLERPQVTVGSSVVLKGGNLENGVFKAPRGMGSAPQIIATGHEKDFLKTSMIPFGHYAMPINQFSFGLNVYAPYGVNIGYSDTFPGRTFGLKTKLETVNFQGTFAYKLRDNLSIGVGLVASRISGELTEKKYSLLVPKGIGAKVTGDDMRFTWNIGALWQPLPKTTLGLSYHAKTTFKLSGKAEADLGNPLLNFRHDATLDITMPDSLMLSATQVLNDQWTVMADVTWVRWSTIKEIRVVDKEPFLVKTADQYVPLDWRNTLAFSLGTAYHLTDDWTLRAGYMYEQTPTSDHKRTVRVPDNDRNWFTAGARWNASQDLSIDFAAAYLMMKDGTVDQKAYKPDETVDPEGGRFTGDYKHQNTWVLSGQVTYRF